MNVICCRLHDEEGEGLVPSDYLLRPSRGRRVACVYDRRHTFLHTIDCSGLAPAYWGRVLFRVLRMKVMNHSDPCCMQTFADPLSPLAAALYWELPGEERRLGQSYMMALRSLSRLFLPLMVVKSNNS